MKNIKLGCTVSTYETKFGPIVFKDGDLDRDFDIMRSCGYTGTDIFVNDVSPSVLRSYRRSLENHGVSVATFIAIYLGESGVRLSEPDSAHRKRNIELVKHQLDNAAYLGASGMAMGFIRGTWDKANESYEDCLARIADGLAEVGEYARSVGTKVLLEPINRYEMNTILTATEATDFIRSNKLEGVGILLDAFHMNIEDKNLGQSIRYAAPYAVNMHLADTNRHALGQGHLDVKEVVEALRDIDFEGFLTLEVFSDNPRRDMLDTAEVLNSFEKETSVHFGSV